MKKVYKNHQANSPLKAIILTLVLSAVLVTGFVFLFTSDKKPSSVTAAYSVKDIERPMVELNQTSVDLGEIKVADVKIQDFSLKNTGLKPLQITGISSSCGCTAGQIVYKDQVSKEYSMHSKSEFVTEIAPGETATVRLTYRPATMPVYGPVERAVFVTTNDPANSQLVFSVKASVK